MKHNTTVIRPALIMIPLALALLFSACNLPANNPITAPTATLPAPSQPTAEATIEAVTPPTAAVEPTSVEGSLPSASLDVSGVAQGVASQVVAAVPPGPDTPWWEIMPEYTLLTLEGYPVAEHLMQPQVFVYPVEELGVSAAAREAAESLQALLQDRQLGDSLPYLPLYNQVQMMHAQPQYLGFKNGDGVRYLTEYAQGIVPINNRELLYTYQGLTADGKYYLAVVLPVNLPGLPANPDITGDLPADFMNDYSQYKADTVAMLDQQPANAFTPDLSRLDMMVQSIEIK